MTENHSLHEDEIDLIALLQQLWKARTLILKVSSAFVLVGIAVALLTPTKYKAQTVFIPQVSDASAGVGSKLGGLASLAGISLGAASDGMNIPPTLYPNITSSVPFKLAFLASDINVQGKEQSIEDYLLAQPKSLLSGLFGKGEETEKQSPNGVLQLSSDQENLFEQLSEILAVGVNEKEGYVSLSVLWKDPVVAAQLAEVGKALLQEQVIAYKLEKLNDNLLFTQKQYTQKQKEFEGLQDRLALFKDRNQNISSSRFQSQLQRLQSEYDIALSVVQELAKQLETTKLQVNRDTPIFTVIEPVVVPHEREQPKRKLIVLIWAFLGAVLSCGWVLVRQPAKEIFSKINA